VCVCGGVFSVCVSVFVYVFWCVCVGVFGVYVCVRACDYKLA
jgi:hypothetical protein